MAKLSLAEHVQALPAELFNEVLELTLRIEPGIVHINKDYKPPVQLHLNRSIRAAVAKEYYRRAKFTIKASGNTVADTFRLYLFLKAAPVSHLRLIDTVRFWQTEQAWLIAKTDLSQLTEENKDDINHAWDHLEIFEDHLLNHVLHHEPKDGGHVYAALPGIRTNIWEMEQDGGLDEEWFSGDQLEDGPFS